VDPGSSTRSGAAARPARAPTKGARPIPGRACQPAGPALEGRDDLDVSEPAQECTVCQQIRPRGSYDKEQGVFVCAGCQRDAKQFLEIQDDLYGDGVGRGSAGDGD
jgi:hypothetical protein